MGFGQAISTGFVKYINFNDRACRSEFWYWSLFTFAVGILTAIIDGQLDIQVTNVAFQVVTFIPSLAVAVRRLHDIDNSGWWVLIAFLPILGFIVLVIFWAMRGTDGSNRFGPDPLAEDPSANQPFGAPA